MGDSSRLALGAALVAAIIIGLIYITGGSQDEVVPVATTEPAQIDGARIINADSEPQNWLAHGRTYSEQRYSPLDQINDQNVGELGLAWAFETGTDRGLEASPIVDNGVMYLTGSWSTVFALDALTGELLWEFDPEVPRGWGRYACCDVVNRGVAVWKGKVYFGTIHGHLIALDAKTGEKIWDVDTVDSKPPYTITGAPRIVNDKVIIGNGGAEFGVRGFITAYDTETGEQVWRFYTVPGNPDEPFEHAELEEAAKTWGGAKWWEMGGGGTAWDSMAYDPDLNTLYVGVGNGSPWNRNVRSPDGGDNLYLSSILAIDPDTGKMKWYYQTTPGESWDYTATQHIILADLDWKGETRKVLMQAPKNGFFYVIDRETGELLSAEKYVPVVWATHVDMETGRPVENPNARYTERWSVVSPIPIGGHNWHPMAYNKDNGLVYIPAMEITSVAEPDVNDFKFRPGSWNLGQSMDNQLDAPPEFFAGKLIAWDPIAGKERWHIQHWGGWNGGVLTTAGNLVFQGTGDGFVKAHNATTGKTLWQAPAGTGVIAPPVTWSKDGAQYVTVLAGWGGAYALAYGRAAKAAGVARGGTVLTFKLGGEAELDPMRYAVETPEPIGPSEDSKNAELVKHGAIKFADNCAVCHGIGAVAGGVIQDLRYSAPEVFDMYDEIVLEGLMEERGMANFSDVVTAEDVRAIKAYIIARAQEGDVPTDPLYMPDYILEELGLAPETE